MPVNIIDTLKPKNGLNFPVVEAIDVFVEDYGNLADAISHFATDAMIAAINAVLSDKANTSDVNTAVSGLQAQIDQIAQAAGTGSADTEVAQARVDADGTTYQTLKARLDASDSNVSQIKDDLDEFKTDFFESGCAEAFLPSDFTNGEITVTSQIATINTNVKYRIATPEPISYGYEIKATPASGFRIFVYYVDEDQKAIDATGWKTEQVTVPANSLIMIILARVEDDRTEIANISEFISKYTVTPSATKGAVAISEQALNATAQNAADIAEANAEIQVMSEIMLEGSDGYTKMYETAVLGEAHSDGQNYDNPRASTTTAIMRELYDTNMCPNIGFDDTIYKALTVYYDSNHDFVNFDPWTMTSPVTALSTSAPYVSFEFRRLDGADISQDELATICWTFDVELNKVNSTAFVDGTNGNDTTGKGTKSAPFKTIGKAVTFGASNICLKPMTYTENVVITGNYNKSIHIYTENVDWGSNVNRPKAIIDGDGAADTVLKISKCKSLILEDIIVQNSGTGQKGCIIEYCQNLQMQNCEFLNNGHDGCVINYTNGVIRDCIANFNGNDGFNMNYYGDTQFINCSGHDNVDDGISHHQGTTGLIDGGEWYNNGKGGVASPAHGSRVDLKNLYCHNNGYGVYANCDSDAEARTFRMWNCVLKDNHANAHTGSDGGYGLTCKRNTCIMYNCKIADNDHQTTAPSGGSIIDL